MREEQTTNRAAAGAAAIKIAGSNALLPGDPFARGTVTRRDPTVASPERCRGISAIAEAGPD